MTQLRSNTISRNEAGFWDFRGKVHRKVPYLGWAERAREAMLRMALAMAQGWLRELEKRSGLDPKTLGLLKVEDGEWVAANQYSSLRTKKMRWQVIPSGESSAFASGKELPELKIRFWQNGCYYFELSESWDDRKKFELTDTITLKPPRGSVTFKFAEDTLKRLKDRR